LFIPPKLAIGQRRPPDGSADKNPLPVYAFISLGHLRQIQAHSELPCDHLKRPPWSYTA
jgi:hypothetical protein